MTYISGSGFQQENTISGGTRHPALGVHPGWRLHHQGSLLTTSQPTGIRNRAHLEQGLESRSLAQNLHLSLASGAQ
jgi:hypothetical protein